MGKILYTQIEITLAELRENDFVAIQLTHEDGRVTFSSPGYVHKISPKWITTGGVSGERYHLVAKVTKILRYDYIKPNLPAGA